MADTHVGKAPNRTVTVFGRVSSEMTFSAGNLAYFRKEPSTHFAFPTTVGRQKPNSCIGVSLAVVLSGAVLVGCARATDIPGPATAQPMKDRLKSTKRRSLTGEFQTGDQKPTDPACVQKALVALKTDSPSGYATYQKLNDPKFFATFIEGCADDEEFYLSSVPSAVHESVHAVRATTEAYFLITGHLLPVPATDGYFPPREMAQSLEQELKGSDDYFDTYIRPGGDPASSKDDFTYLLDELNAYTNDLQATMDLTAITPLHNREAGVAAMMTFVAAYVGFAQANHPSTFQHLAGDKAMRNVLDTLWSQADNVLRNSCAYRAATAFDDSKYLAYLCDARKTGALAAALGRPVRCPVECRDGDRAI